MGEEAIKQPTILASDVVIRIARNADAKMAFKHRNASYYGLTEFEYDCITKKLEEEGERFKRILKSVAMELTKAEKDKDDFGEKLVARNGAGADLPLDKPTRTRKK